MADFFGTAGDDTIAGTSGDDNFYASGGTDLIYAGGGSDTLVLTGDYSNYTIADNLNGTYTIIDHVGGDGIIRVASIEILQFANITIPFAVTGADLQLTANDDVFLGTIGGDRLFGLAGNDNLEGAAGDDYIDGGDGDDIILGGVNDDTLLGGGGNDDLRGGPNEDLIYGGDGEDLIYGDAFDDILYGDEGADTIYGGAGEDVVYGGTNADLIFGGDGNDTLFANADPASGASGNGPPVANAITPGSGQYVRPENAGNSDLANAIDVSNLFSLNFDADIVDSETIPHVSITAVGDVTPSFHWYSVDIDEANTTITLDIDYGTAGGRMDSYIYLRDSAGALIALDDDSSTSQGAGGSTSGLDSFLTRTLADAGVYYVVVGTFSNDPVESGDTYELQISIDLGRDLDAGDDILNGGAGDDIIVGTFGNQTAVYSGVSGNYTLSEIADGEVVITDLVGNDGTDTLTYIDQLQFSDGIFSVSDLLNPTVTLTAGDDIYTAPTSASTYYGNLNDDEIYALAGNDNIDSGDGDDLVDGGDGNDTINAGLGNDTVYGGNGNDTLNSGAGNDTVYDGDGDDIIDAGLGNDTVYGGGGDDTIEGGDGTDILFLNGSVLNHTISELSGVVTVTDSSGVNGTDTLTAIEQINFDEGMVETNSPTELVLFNQDITLDFSLGIPSSFTQITAYVGPESNVTFESAVSGITFTASNQSSDIGLISFDTLTGSEFDDDLTSSSISDVFGLGGNDEILVSSSISVAYVEGGDGNDTITSNADGTFYGQEGDDVITVSNTQTSNIYGGEGNDVLTGGNQSSSFQNDRIFGGDGNDFLYGRSGNDILEGGFGVDWLRGDAGADQLNGGAGADWANYSNSNAAVDVNLLTGVGAGGHADGDTYTLIERVYGSSFDDNIRGDAGINYLRGAAGDDILRGESGNDYLQGDAGEDILIGGDGSDWAYYVSAAAGLVINLSDIFLNTGEAAGDIYSSIENILGSRFDDTITGNSQGNVLRGFLGDDMIYGGSGDDFLRGDAGADFMDGGTGNDWLYYVASSGAITIDLEAGTASGGDAQGDTFNSIERVYGSRFDDNITGDSGLNYLRGYRGDDILIGGAGTDFLQGGIGADTLDGGAGTDWAYYVSTAFSVTVDLSNSANNAGEAAGDIYISIESVRGSNHNDIITGDDGTNYLIGGYGDDILNGGAGNDTLRGDAGADIFVFVNGTFRDTVIDFDDAENDMLDFSDFGFVDAADALSNAADVNGDVVFTIGVDIITIENTTIVEITDNLIL